MATYFVVDFLQLLFTRRQWWCSYWCWCLSLQFGLCPHAGIIIAILKDLWTTNHCNSLLSLPSLHWKCNLHIYNVQHISHSGWNNFSSQLGSTFENMNKLTPKNSSHTLISITFWFNHNKLPCLHFTNILLHDFSDSSRYLQWVHLLF